jgi:hypothetical protein
VRFEDKNVFFFSALKKRSSLIVHSEVVGLAPGQKWHFIPGVGHHSKNGAGCSGTPLEQK